MRIRMGVGILALMAATTAIGFAQSGADTYKAKCQFCHGVKGMGDGPVGTTLKVKPVTDPSVKKLTEAAMIESTRNGMGKMQPFKGKLTDGQIKETVNYFRSFIK